MAFDDLEGGTRAPHQSDGEPAGGSRTSFICSIREKLNEMRAFGMPLPDDLVRLEKELEAEFKRAERAAKKR